MTMSKGFMSDPCGLFGGLVSCWEFWEILLVCLGLGKNIYYFVGAMGRTMFLDYLLLIFCPTFILKVFGGNGMVVWSQRFVCKQPHDQLALEKKLRDLWSLEVLSLDFEPNFRKEKNFVYATSVLIHC
jgi:hypothetical protein